ncbi:hypothetical protein BDZ88DRAFT_455465 [Geranomyces variabilis]|nr:hypothetical protein BDZ88DRAFT_455465 [Geranomyces variabilis]KAJ3132764.1 hypothetical protein HDU90_006652 [Geranomyces variabilis]
MEKQVDSQQLLPRLKFLHDASHAVHNQQPALSRFLLTTLTDAATFSNTPLPEKITKRFCSRCNSWYVPGGGNGYCSTRVAVAKNEAAGRSKGLSACQRRRRGLRRGLKHGEPASLEKNSNVVINDFGPDDAWKLEKPVLNLTSASMAKKAQRPTPSKHRPGLVTHVAYTCGFCEAETRYPGKTAKHVTQMRQSAVEAGAAKQHGTFASSETAAPATPSSAAAAYNRQLSIPKPKKALAAASAQTNKVASSTGTAAGAPSKPSKKNKRKAELQSLLVSSKSRDSAGEPPLSLTDFLSSL